MKQANGLQRFCSWVIDFSVLIPIYFLSWKIIEVLLKTYRHYPPVKRTGMMFYTKAQYEAFFTSFIFILIVAIIIVNFLVTL